MVIEDTFKRCLHLPPIGGLQSILGTWWVIDEHTLLNLTRESLFSAAAVCKSLTTLHGGQLTLTNGRYPVRGW
jgi:hypothetical protein